jgi:hypothetical protein
VGTIDCGTDVLLYSLPNIAGAWQTGGVNPGQSITKHWNNAPLNATYVVGASPQGATNTGLCQFEVSRLWYQQQPGGERELWFTLTNIGGIACTADILLGFKTTATSGSTGTLAPGGSSGTVWNNANPLTTAYIVGFSPQGATDIACEFELTQVRYLQRINSDGRLEREFWFNYGNVGAITCSATWLLAAA